MAVSQWQVVLGLGMPNASRTSAQPPIRETEGITPPTVSIQITHRHGVAGTHLGVVKSCETPA